MEIKLQGVYTIENIGNGKVYIRSTDNIERRWIKEHVYQLKKNKHHTEIAKANMRNAWKKRRLNDKT